MLAQTMTIMNRQKVNGTFINSSIDGLVDFNNVDANNFLRLITKINIQSNLIFSNISFERNKISQTYVMLCSVLYLISIKICIKIGT